MNTIATLILLAMLATPAAAQILADGVYVPSGHKPVKVVAAELDGQPGVDIVSVSDTTGTVSILLNQGDGTFSSPLVTIVEPYTTLYTLCAADLDGDLDNDLIIGRSSRPLLILVNDGAAGFTFGQTIPTNGQHTTREICAGDVDGDQDIDVLWGNPTLGGGLWLAVNEGGTFAAPVELFHSKADDPVVAYLNDDLFLDVAFHRGSPYEIVVLLGLGDGTFQAPTTYSVNADCPIRDLAVADFDGDMDLDLLCEVSFTAGSSPYIFELTNLGDGTFGGSNEIAYDFSGLGYGFIAPDLNGSGCADLLPVCAYSLRRIVLNDCTSTDADEYNYLLPPATAFDVTAADLDGDTDLDVVYAVPAASSVLVHFNNSLVLTAAEGETPGVTAGLRIESLHPNPFNPRAVVTFTVPTAGPVRLEAFDLRGRRSAVLLEGTLEAGYHEAEWDANDLPSGVYLVRLTASGRTTEARLTLVR